MAVVALAVHAALMLSAAAGAAWAAPALAAWLAGADLPTPPWRAWRRLWRKAGPASMRPAIALAPTLAAALLVPGFSLGMATAPASDMFSVIVLLAAGRAVMGLAAVQAVGGPGGLAVSRAALAWAGAAPALLLAALVLAAAGGSANLDAALGALHDQGGTPRVPLLLAAAAVAIAGLRDAAEPPVAFGGPALACLQAAEAVRRLVWMTLAAALAGPAPGAEPAGWAVGAALWLGKVGLLTAGLGLAEARGWRAPPGLAVLLAVLAALLLGFAPGPA